VTDLELLKTKAAQLDRALERIRSKLPSSLKAFKADADAQDIVYRNFEIVVQNCVDMGSHVIAAHEWPTPRTMGEVFDLLAAHGAISRPLGQALRAMVTVRNILVHDYTRLDHGKAYRLIRRGTTIAPRFCLRLLKTARRKPT